MSGLQPFHLAIPARDIANTRKFYVEVLGCTVGRTADKWIDFKFYGHQLSAHVKPDEIAGVGNSTVDGANVPVRHFGIVLELGVWEALSRTLMDTGIEFLVKPAIRFKGQIGEQATLFIKDPSGYVLEFKAFRDDRRFFCGGLTTTATLSLLQCIKNTCKTTSNNCIKYVATHNILVYTALQQN